MGEIWKDVVGYEGRYLISNTGKLKSILKNGVEKLLKGSLSKQGYWQYSLNWKEKNKYNVYTTQQLVAISFLNHYPDSTKGYVIDHINDNRLDNRLENLRLVTNHQNSIKRFNHSNLFGTSKQKENGKWRSNIWHNKKNICLGFFNTDLEAHLTVIDYMNKNNIKRKI